MHPVSSKDDPISDGGNDYYFIKTNFIIIIICIMIEGLLEWINPRGNPVEDVMGANVYATHDPAHEKSSLFFMGVKKSEAGRYTCKYSKVCFFQFSLSFTTVLSHLLLMIAT